MTFLIAVPLCLLGIGSLALSALCRRAGSLSSGAITLGRAFAVTGYPNLLMGLWTLLRAIFVPDDFPDGVLPVLLLSHLAASGFLMRGLVLLADDLDG